MTELAERVDNAADFPPTLPGLLARNAARYGDRIGLREKDLGIWQEVSWKEYYAHVGRFCLGIRRLGLKRGDRLAILGDNCPEWIYADLAAQAAGAIAVGVYPTNPANQVAYVVGHSDAVMVVAKDQEQTDKILDVRDQLPKLTKIIVVDMKGLRKYRDPMIVPFSEVEELGGKELERNPAAFEELVSATRSDDVALMVYTSGTTGPPKGAMLTHGNIMTLCRSFERVVPTSESDQVVSYLPLCHVAERIMSVFLALYAGYTVNFAESVATVQESLYEISPTLFVGVPRIWEKMYAAIMINMKDASRFKRWMFKLWIGLGRRTLERRLQGNGKRLSDRLLFYLGYLCVYRQILDKLGLLRTRLAMSGAAPISPEVLKFYRVIGLPIAQVYGQTEVTGVSHYQPGEDMNIGSVGHPFAEVDFRLAEDGEIMLRGPSVFAGYYKDDEATKRTVRDGWLYTGDVGELDEQGYLYITDRKKDILITSGGKNIAPSEIENRLKFSPYINEAIVVGDGRPFLTALIQIEYDTVGKWAMDRGIAFTTFKSLAGTREVFELIEKEVAEANRDFAKVETIKKFTLLDKELDHDDDEVTATMKVRRSTIEKKFKDLIEAMYRK
ncbi:MAG: AMP-binding protein [Desulfomonilaceae bacterium]|nr:AMP-binding protein [Desulfomonilaceae bacterium]